MRVLLRVRASAVLTVFAVTTSALALAAPQAQAADFGPSGVHGGGYQNVIVQAPSDAKTKPGRLLAGSDVAGFHVSDDRGVTWRPSNFGLAEQDHRSVAGVSWSRDGTDDVFALVGRAPSRDGAVVWSKNGGDTWSTLYDKPAAPIRAAANFDNNRPRLTGALIVAVNARTVYAAGTNGLFRFTRAAELEPWCALPGSCGPVAYTGDQEANSIRSLVFANQVLYVAVVGTGIVPFTQLGTSSGPVRGQPLPGLTIEAKGQPRTLAFADGRVFLAAGTAGVFSCILGATPSCSTQGLTGLGSSVDWTTLAYNGRTGSDFKLYVGCGSNTCPQDVVLSHGPLSTTGWTALSSRDNRLLVSDTETQYGPQWWLGVKLPAYLFGGGQYSTAQLLVDQNSPPTGDRIYAAGRSGVWRRTAGAAWRPAMQGLSAVVSRQVVADPSGPQADHAVSETDTDWSAITSNNSFAFNQSPFSTLKPNTSSAPADAPPLGGYVMAVSRDRTYVGTGYKPGDQNKGAVNGSVWSCVTAGTGPLSCSSPDSWQNEHLDDALDLKGFGPGLRVLGVAAGVPPTAPGATTPPRLVVAAVEAAGIFVKSGGGEWKQVPGTMPLGVATTNNRIDIGFRDLSHFVYVYSPGQGVYRSTDIVGKGSGIAIPATPYWSPPTNGTGADTNYMASNPNDENELYVTTSMAAYRLTPRLAPPLDKAREQVLTSDGTLQYPGPVAVDTAGRVLIGQQVRSAATAGSLTDDSEADATANGAMLFGAVPDQPKTQLYAMTDRGYQRQALFADSLSVSTDPATNCRTIYVSDRGSGVAVKRETGAQCLQPVAAP